MEDLLLGFGFALIVSAITTPAGVSGAVFLLPVQVSVLNVPSPSVTPTNLLYNVLAVPGALFRFAKLGVLRGDRLTRLLVSGTLPGAVIGAVLRVELLASAEVFLVVIGAVLVPLGLMLVGRRVPAAARAVGDLGDGKLVLFSFAVGIVGGIYGIGGGSVMAPVLVLLGLSVRKVAPAALTSTFLTSLVGIATYALLSLRADDNIAPDWLLGVCLGAGGLVGGYIGATFQSRVPEQRLRQVLGVVAILLGGRYLVVGLS